MSRTPIHPFVVFVLLAQILMADSPAKRAVIKPAKVADAPARPATAAAKPPASQSVTGPADKPIKVPTQSPATVPAAKPKVPQEAPVARKGAAAAQKPAAAAQKAPPKAPAKAQVVKAVQQPIKPSAKPTPLVLPTVGLISADRQIRVKLTRAQELLKRKETAAALPLLQLALQCPVDSAYSVNGLERSLLRCIRWEAEQLIGRLPLADRETYELLFGPDANQALQHARNNADLAAMKEVSLRYFYTQAGREATYLLGAAYFDLGRPLEAGVWFDRLRQGHETPEHARNALALQSAVAWSMSGMPEVTQSHLSDLWLWNPQGTMKLGVRTINLFNDDSSAALKWLRSLSGAADHKRPLDTIGWPVVGGNATRNATGSKVQPGTQTVWKAATSAWKVRVEDAPFSNGVINVARQINAIEQGFRKSNQPAIPATSPLIVDDVVLVKNLSQLQAFDLQTGNLRWQTHEVNDLERVRNGEVAPLPGNSGSILDPMLTDRVFTNLTHGTMSSNGRMVFAVSELGFLAQNPTNNVLVRSNANQQHPLCVKAFSRLIAIDIASGRRMWRAGGPASSKVDAVSGRYFLGPPLPLAGQLYCLTERKQQIELVILNATSGKPDWSRPLQSFAIGVANDANRASAGLSPSYSNGLLICPTGSGIVVALDLATRELTWSYRYRELDDGDPRRRMRMIAMARMVAQRKGQTLAPPKPGRWLDSSAIIVGNQVIVTPRDSSELICLDQRTGSLQWKLPREDRTLIAGIHDKHLVVIGAGTIELLNLENGQSKWKRPPAIPLPSGRCVLTTNQLYVPLSSGDIATLDLNNGDLRIEKVGFAPGNLIAANGSVITQGSSFVARVSTSRD